MGPKPKKGDKKGKAAANDDEINPAEMNLILGAQVDSLKQRLVLEQERRDKSMAKEEEMRLTEIEIDKQMQEHKAQTKMHVETITETYSKMEDSFKTEIKQAEDEVEEQEKQIKELNEKIALAKKRREEEVEAKN